MCSDFRHNHIIKNLQTHYICHTLHIGATCTIKAPKPIYHKGLAPKTTCKKHLLNLNHIILGEKFCQSTLNWYFVIKIKGYPLPRHLQSPKRALNVSLLAAQLLCCLCFTTLQHEEIVFYAG
jgi:hypothetical protein